MLDHARRLAPRFALPVAGLSLLALVAVLYFYYPAAYMRLNAVMIKVPAPRPFVDWEWIPSSVRCWSEGVNVYVNNTCYKVWDDLGFNYSPLWLRASFLRSGEDWSGAAGLSLAVLFLLSLAALPPPRGALEDRVRLLIMLSCGTWLGIERGNADLLMFLLVFGALNLRRLPLPFRLFGYSLIALAGLLKFYPFVALVVVLRERWAVLAAVAAASVAALGALAVAYHQELGWMARNLPPPSYYTLQFGAANLPAGLGVTTAKVLTKALHWGAGPAQAAGDAVAAVLKPLLTVLALVAAAAFARRHRLMEAQARLSARDAEFLAVGAAVVCGCFFAGQSVIYRGVYLMLALPGLSALWHHMPTQAGRRAFAATSVAAAFVLWVPFLETILAGAGLTVRIPYAGDAYDWFPGSVAGYALWLLSELAWWGIITMLLAAAGAFMAGTEAWATLRRFRPGTEKKRLPMEAA